jgi:replication factor A3
MRGDPKELLRRKDDREEKEEGALIFTHFFKISPSFLSAPDQKKHRKNNTMTTTNIDISAPKPKVNGEQMGLFSGKTVQLVLETTSNSEGGSVLKGKAADGMEVTARLDQSLGAAPRSRFIEVEGVVTGPQEIKATNVASFGESVDLFAYNEMCKMLHAKGREMIL